MTVVNYFSNNIGYRLIAIAVSSPFKLNMNKVIKQKVRNKNDVDHKLKNNLITILRRLKARHDVQQLSISIKNQRDTKMQTDITNNNENIQNQAFVPQELLRIPRNPSLLSSHNGRNSYNIYPVLEKQEIEKKLNFTCKHQKSEHSIGKTRKQEKLPYLKFVPVDKEEQNQNKSSENINIIMRQVTKLRNTLNVNKKTLNQIRLRPINKRYAFHAAFTKNKFDDSVEKKNYSINVERINNEVSSWNSPMGSKDEEENSLQALIL